MYRVSCIFKTNMSIIPLTNDQLQLDIDIDYNHKPKSQQKQNRMQQKDIEHKLLYFISTPHNYTIKLSEYDITRNDFAYHIIRHPLSEHLVHFSPFCHLISLCPNKLPTIYLPFGILI